MKERGRLEVGEPPGGLWLQRIRRLGGVGELLVPRNTGGLVRDHGLGIQACVAGEPAG